ALVIGRRGRVIGRDAAGQGGEQPDRQSAPRNGPNHHPLTPASPPRRSRRKRVLGLTCSTENRAASRNNRRRYFVPPTGTAAAVTATGGTEREWQSSRHPGGRWLPSW